MKRSALALCAGLFLLGLMPGSALATSGVLDQSNASTGLSAGTASMLAQTFTAGKTGSLTEVDLFMNGDGAHAINATIQATSGGLPNGTVLATSGSGTPPTGSGSWVPFSFSSQPGITSGTVYAIVFSPGNYTAVLGSLNTYGGGQALIYNGSAWQPTSGAGIPLDFAFQTYVGTTASPPTHVDQSNGPTESTCLANNTDGDLAQTFTAGQSGSLTGVDLWMSGNGTASVTVSIEATTSGKPNGPAMATATATPPTNPAWVHFSFSPAPSVTSGTMYAIVFNTPTSTDICLAATYAGGAAYAYDAGWGTYANGEFAFQTYVGGDAAAPAPTSAGTAPPTNTHAGPSSNESGSASLLVTVALIALFSGLVVLVSAERRRTS